MGLRLGENPRAVITTTPKPITLLKDMLRDSQLNPEQKEPLVYVTRGTTYENRGNLAPKFLAVILRKYEGTRLGRQELDAEMLDDAPGALWQRTQIDADRVTKVPELVRIVIAIDPSVSSDSDEAETGIIAAGLGTDGHGYILGDGSMIKPTPEQWAMSAITLFNTNHADRVIGEVNNGGDLVEANVAAVAKSLTPPQRIPFKQVRASRGKQVRAEPISSFYEQHRVHHVGSFPLLEDQLCQWEPGVSTWSPNRLDALVWALTELMFGPAHKDIDLSGGGGGRGWSRT
jgi:phage terminase large subunit-like protein